MRFVKATSRDRIGTGGRGSITTTYNQLCNRFGFPHDCTQEGAWYSGDGKVRYEWAFKSLDGRMIVTIYDYKDKRPPEEIKEWRIGGKGNSEKIKSFFAAFCPHEQLEIR